jgi:hypothetical protein
VEGRKRVGKPENKTNGSVLKVTSTGFCCLNTPSGLSKATSFALRLQKGKQVALADWTLHIADNGAVGIIQKFNADLGDATTRACAPDDLGNLSVLDWLVHRGGDGGERRRTLRDFSLAGVYWLRRAHEIYP